MQELCTLSFSVLQEMHLPQLGRATDILYNTWNAEILCQL